MNRMYQVCRSCVGKNIWVRTHSGKIYKGRALRVTTEHLYLQSLGYGVNNEEVGQIKGKHAINSSSVNGEEILYGAFALPLLGIGAVGFLGGAVGGFFGGFLGARAGTAPFYGRYF